MDYNNEANIMAAQNENEQADEALRLRLRLREEEEQRNAAAGAAAGTPPDMVKWRGNLVPEKEAKALRHVFDNLQDHFAYQRPDPSVIFNTTGLTHSGQDDNIWNGELNFTYDINGDHCNLSYMSMDVCIDLAPKLVHRHGQPVLKDYGKSWVYVYLPEQTYEKIKTYVKIGTGWDVSDEGTVYDPNRNLIAIEANIHYQPEQPKPSFWAVQDKEDASGRDVYFSRLGSLQEVNEQSQYQCVHRGVGMFSVSMQVEGTPNFEPTPAAGDEADLIFTLVSVRTWGRTECIAPIVYAPNKCE